jgi:hypothetical protein
MGVDLYVHALYGANCIQSGLHYRPANLPQRKVAK